MQAPVIAALISFAAALIGLGFQRHRELKAAREEREKIAKVTARILLADLLQATNRLRLADKNGRYWSGRYAMPLDSWLAHREVVAQHMDLEQWNDVSLFFRSLGTAELQSQSAREKSERRRPTLSTYQRSQVNLARVRGEEAKKALQEFSGDYTQETQDGDLEDEEVAAAGRDGG